MTTHPEVTVVSRGVSSGVFDDIVVGVDESDASREAARQAGRLRAPDGSLRLLAVVDVPLLLKSGWSAPALQEDLRFHLRRGLESAGSEVPDASHELREGSPASVLMDAAQEGATLLAVGTHELPRARGILLSSVATRVVHEAPCSVLVARPSIDRGSFPRSIVVGVDGSRDSLAALEAAQELRDRFAASLDVVAAMGGKPVDVDGLRRVDALQWDGRTASEALVVRSTCADLLVVGCRGLHGFAALGSVSERVAHRSRASVLVVRRPDAARD